MPNCYYYNEHLNHCRCYDKESLNDLLAENTKLRELIAELWSSCPVSDDDCEICKYKDWESVSGCELYERMRELGVEP